MAIVVVLERIIITITITITITIIITITITASNNNNNNNQEQTGGRLAEAVKAQEGAFSYMVIFPRSACSFASLNFFEKSFVKSK